MTTDAIRGSGTGRGRGPRTMPPIRAELVMDVGFRPAATLAALAPGQILPLDASAAGLRVVLRAGGEALAAGRLVQIGGTLAFEVTET